MRPSLLAAICLLFHATTAAANGQAKPNTLTAQEIADGWILLYDGESTFGWTAQHPVDPVYWEFAGKDGALVLATKKGGWATMAYTTPFRHFELAGEYRVTGPHDYTRADFDIRLRHENPIVGSAFPIELPASKDWMPFTVRLAPESRKATVGDKVVREWTAPSGPDKDRFAPVILQESRLGFSIPERSEIRFELRNLKLRPLATTPLFTGKNLDGWKVNAADPKRMKSKFAVTAGGELAVKDGPGDLVTDKEFASFVLQLECKTLSDGLNSGIFFRCIPGQYQNGYEAQIQNAFLDNDRTKPKDFGTGAIYRRVKARKVVATDNEWFTMTVVANGNHLATWVNGYQTVDWTDDRKPHENPRQGYRAAKGPISIQGHDPTTDLLFRNIRVAELPGK